MIIEIFYNFTHDIAHYKNILNPISLTRNRKGHQTTSIPIKNPRAGADPGAKSEKTTGKAIRSG